MQIRRLAKKTKSRLVQDWLPEKLIHPSNFVIAFQEKHYKDKISQRIGEW